MLMTPMLALVALGGATTTLTVGPSGTYATIAEAVDAAMVEDSIDGYIIAVEAGTYTIGEDSQIVITDLQGPLTIQADSESSTVIIDGDNLYRCIDASSIDLTLRDLVLQNGASTSTGDDGGCALVSQGSLALDNVSFSDCEAVYSGGGVYAYAAGPIAIVDCSFTDCSANRGGGLYATSSVINISTSTFTSCTAAVDGHGGGLYANSGGTLDEVVFMQCTGGSGGAARLADDSTITSCWFEQCSATWTSGGAVMMIATGKDLVVDTCMFVKCTADQHGGAVYCRSVLLGATDSTFTGNTSTDGTGGAILCSNGSGTISGCMFNDNSAYYSGGAIRFQSTNDTDPMLISIASCSFDGNTAGTSGSGYGGAITLETWSSGYGGFSATISDSSIADCSATRGGGIYATSTTDAADIVLTNCSLSGNTSSMAGTYDAVHVTGSGMAASMESCTACNHAYGYEIDGDIIDEGLNDFGAWCCPGDVDDNGDVDADDLLSIISLTWGDTGTEDVQDDVDRNSVVDVSDLILMLHNWGSCD